MAFDPAIADKVLDGLVRGLSLRQASELHGVSQRTFLDWVESGVNPEFSAQYARVRKIGYLTLAEEILEIADTPMLGVETKTKADGTVETTEGDMLAHRRLQVDTRKWMLSKMLPKVYGDKLELAGDKDNPLTVVVRKLTDQVKPNGD